MTSKENRVGNRSNGGKEWVLDCEKKNKELVVVERCKRKAKENIR